MWHPWLRKKKVRKKEGVWVKGKFDPLIFPPLPKFRYSFPPLLFYSIRILNCN